VTKFADATIKVTDAQRVRKIREFDAGRIDRQFAPIKARAARNAKAVTGLKGWLAIA
jgi:hypothetical protein